MDEAKQDGIFTNYSPLCCFGCNDFACKYIYAAKENNIVNGDGNGNYKPESNITNEENVKMIVCLLNSGTYHFWSLLDIY